MPDAVNATPTRKVWSADAKEAERGRTYADAGMMVFRSVLMGCTGHCCMSVIELSVQAFKFAWNPPASESIPQPSQRRAMRHSSLAHLPF